LILFLKVQCPPKGGRRSYRKLYATIFFAVFTADFGSIKTTKMLNTNFLIIDSAIFSVIDKDCKARDYALYLRTQ
jgi:hypothetical protein